MDNRVYYGEYTLQYWIELMLTRKIELPPYQRYYVWDRKRLRKFIAALKERRFVPPVTIAEEKDGGKIRNYIIDGQQRLTSILLSYLGVWPIKSAKKELLDEFANGSEGGEISARLRCREWRYDCLLGEDNSKAGILSRAHEQKCGLAAISQDEDFYRNTYMGFSYLIPGEKTNQQLYFAKVFKEINVTGMKLTEQESREALYFLKSNMRLFFDPSFTRDIILRKSAGRKPERLDFVRYVSMLADYIHRGKSTDGVATGSRAELADYYEDYICSVITSEDHEVFGQFSKLFPGELHESRLKSLEETLSALSLPKEFDSIINLDMSLFGCVYWVLYEGRRLDFARKDALIIALKKEIDLAREKSGRNPARALFLRERIGKSVEVYGKFLANE